MDTPPPAVNGPCHRCQELAAALYGPPRLVPVTTTSIIREADRDDGLCRYHRERTTPKEDQP